MVARSADGLVVEPPTNQRWALELKLKDPDGNILWFGAEPLAGIPFGQELAEGELSK